MTDRDAYEVLQVSPSANTEVIQAAYRALARRHHPDLSSDPRAGSLMAELNAAYESIRDPSRRAEYDRRRVVRLAASGGSTASAPWAGSAGSAGSTSAPSASGASAGTSSTSSTGRASANGAARTSPSTGPTWRRGENGEGAAGPPPGRPYGSILDFGRHIGWSLGEIARVDPGYLEWLIGTKLGAQYRTEVESLLHGAPAGSQSPAANGKRQKAGRFGGGRSGR